MVELLHKIGGHRRIRELALQIQQQRNKGNNKSCLEDVQKALGKELVLGFVVGGSGRCTVAMEQTPKTKCLLIYMCFLFDNI